MTEPATTPPASYCPDAAHTLQWGLHPDSSTQGWILRDGSSVVATLDGYPHGRTPVPADEAREWADRILGGAEEWVEQPARSGAYHRHNSGAAVPPAVAPPTGQAGLRKLIAQALSEARRPGLGGMTEADAVAYMADAVLSVLFGPIPAGTDIATWTAIRAIQLMNEAGRERDAALTQAAKTIAADAALRETEGEYALAEYGLELARLIRPRELRRLAAETPGPETQAVRHAPGTAILCPDCRAKGHSICITDGEQQPETQACEETGSALARYIVEQPASVAQAALRVLGFPPLRMEFELADDPATPPAVVAEPGKECAASVSGNCLAEAQSETGCATEDGECIHAGQPGKEA
jgi:hypothetical protein